MSKAKAWFGVKPQEIENVVMELLMINQSEISDLVLEEWEFSKVPNTRSLFSF